MGFLYRIFNKNRPAALLLILILVFFLFYINGCTTTLEGVSNKSNQGSSVQENPVESTEDAGAQPSNPTAGGTEKEDKTAGSDAEEKVPDDNDSQNKINENYATTGSGTGSEGQEIKILPMAPQIQLQIILGPEYAQAGQICFYRVIAHVAGEPFPQIKFNKDDSNGAWGPNISQINLTRDQSFTLLCEASNLQGTASSSITVNWVENQSPDQTNQAAQEVPAEMQVDYSNPADFFIDVNLSAQKVTVLYKNIELKNMVCSGGQSQTPTPLGMFQTSQKIYYAYIPKFGQAAYYWTRFYGPYLFHSVPYDASGNLLAEELEKMGTPASHGCIRLYLEDAKWMYETLPLGISVSIHN